MRGKCLCGLIEFEIVGVAPKLYQCHCSLCRKQGGASSNTAAIVAKEQFRWLAGQEQSSALSCPLLAHLLLCCQNRLSPV